MRKRLSTTVSRKRKKKEGGDGGDRKSKGGKQNKAHRAKQDDRASVKSSKRSIGRRLSRIFKSPQFTQGSILTLDEKEKVEWDSDADTLASTGRGRMSGFASKFSSFSWARGTADRASGRGTSENGNGRRRWWGGRKDNDRTDTGGVDAERRAFDPGGLRPAEPPPQGASGMPPVGSPSVVTRDGADRSARGERTRGRFSSRSQNLGRSIDTTVPSSAGLTDSRNTPRSSLFGAVKEFKHLWRRNTRKGTTAAEPFRRPSNESVYDTLVQSTGGFAGSLEPAYVAEIDTPARYGWFERYPTDHRSGNTESRPIDSPRGRKPTARFAGTSEGDDSDESTRAGRASSKARGKTPRFVSPGPPSPTSSESPSRSRSRSRGRLRSRSPKSPPSRGAHFATDDDDEDDDEKVSKPRKQYRSPPPPRPGDGSPSLSESEVSSVYTDDGDHSAGPSLPRDIHLNSKEGSRDRDTDRGRGGRYGSIRSFFRRRPGASGIPRQGTITGSVAPPDERYTPSQESAPTAQKSSKRSSFGDPLRILPRGWRSGCTGDSHGTSAEGTGDDRECRPTGERPPHRRRRLRKRPPPQRSKQAEHAHTARSSNTDTTDQHNSGSRWSSFKDHMRILPQGWTEGNTQSPVDETRGGERVRGRRRNRHRDADDHSSQSEGTGPQNDRTPDDTNDQIESKWSSIRDHLRVLPRDWRLKYPKSTPATEGDGTDGREGGATADGSKTRRSKLSRLFSRENTRETPSTTPDSTAGSTLPNPTRPTSRLGRWGTSIGTYGRSLPGKLGSAAGLLKGWRSVMAGDGNVTGTTEGHPPSRIARMRHSAASAASTVRSRFSSLFRDTSPPVVPVKLPPHVPGPTGPVVPDIDLYPDTIQSQGLTMAQFLKENESCHWFEPQDSPPPPDSTVPAPTAPDTAPTAPTSGRTSLFSGWKRAWNGTDGDTSASKDWLSQAKSHIPFMKKKAKKSWVPYINPHADPVLPSTTYRYGTWDHARRKAEKEQTTYSVTDIMKARARLGLSLPESETPIPPVTPPATDTTPIPVPPPPPTTDPFQTSGARGTDTDAQSTSPSSDPERIQLDPETRAEVLRLMRSLANATAAEGAQSGNDTGTVPPPTTDTVTSTLPNPSISPNTASQTSTPETATTIPQHMQSREERLRIIQRALGGGTRDDTSAAATQVDKPEPPAPAPLADLSAQTEPRVSTTDLVQTQDSTELPSDVTNLINSALNGSDAGSEPPAPQKEFVPRTSSLSPSPSISSTSSEGATDLPGAFPSVPETNHATSHDRNSSGHNDTATNGRSWTQRLSNMFWGDASDNSASYSASQGRGVTTRTSSEDSTLPNPDRITGDRSTDHRTDRTNPTNLTGTQGSRSRKDMWNLVRSARQTAEGIGLIDADDDVRKLFDEASNCVPPTGTKPSWRKPPYTTQWEVSTSNKYCRAADYVRRLKHAERSEWTDGTKEVVSGVISDLEEASEMAREYWDLPEG